MSKPRALICGISGQDGAHLADLLLSKGYVVYGTSRDSTSATFNGLEQLGIRERIQILSMAPNDFRSVLSCLVETVPDEIYNLAGQSSVGLSFSQPVETIESVAIGTLNLLEAIRFLGRPLRLYNAGSGECFGDTGGTAATEETPFRPRSPYAVAKACAHNLVANYREAYQLHCSTGILFNHESPLRPKRFVTQKIVLGAVSIYRGEMKHLRLGNIKISRDWGWAPDYVEAMWAMLQLEAPTDFVIATGRSVSLAYFVERAFARLGLNWQEYVQADDGLLRPSDIEFGAANPTKAAQILGWTARHDVDHVINAMVDAAVA
jgi:GDPmannose 4,6-dehydratase